MSNYIAIRIKSLKPLTSSSLMILKIFPIEEYRSVTGFPFKVPRISKCRKIRCIGNTLWPISVTFSSYWFRSRVYTINKFLQLLYLKGSTINLLPAGFPFPIFPFRVSLFLHAMEFWLVRFSNYHFSHRNNNFYLSDDVFSAKNRATRSLLHKHDCFQIVPGNSFCIYIRVFF